jgi:hypothetical protein
MKLKRKISHAKTPRREGRAQEIESLNTFAVFAALRETFVRHGLRILA